MEEIISRRRAAVNFDVPVDVEEGDAGLWYVTSPLVRGLLVADKTEEAALARVPAALRELAGARDDEETRRAARGLS